jgi:hypothetical protein
MHIIGQNGSYALTVLILFTQNFTRIGLDEAQEANISKRLYAKI